MCIMTVLFMCLLPILNETLGDSYITTCPSKSNTTFTENHFSKGNYTLLFYSLIATAVIASSFDATINSFVDSGVLERLKSFPRNSEFGRQRLFGAAGYGIGALVYGITGNYFPTGPISCYAGLFIVYSAFTTSLGFTCYWLFAGSEEKSGETNGNRNDDVRRLIFESLKIYLN